MNGLSLGKKIQEIRSAKGFSVRKTANLAEITPSMLSQIENDLVNPSINTLRCIATALDTPIYIFSAKKTMNLRSFTRRTAFPSALKALRMCAMNC